MKKVYQLHIKVMENGKEVYKPVSPTRGEPYLFPTETAVKNAYRSLYYCQTFQGFNENAKAVEVEVPNETATINHYDIEKEEENKRCMNTLKDLRG